MTRYVGAAEAARLIGVTRATLYAYVSRGLVERRMAVDGRTSLYAVDDLDALSRRGRSRTTGPRPSLDVHIASAITTLDEAGPRYRGRDAATLAATVSFEQAAELLWSGALHDRVDWPRPDHGDIESAREAAGPVVDPIHQIVAATLAVGRLHPDLDAASFARRLFGVIPAVLGDEQPEGGDPRLPARLAAVYAPDAPASLASALKRVLVTLADHELATSTMAVRLAASVRAQPADALVAGLAVLTGPLHGTSTIQAHRFLRECDEEGAAPVVARRLAGREHLPGFGHRIYTGVDPRMAAIREAIGLLADGPAGLALLDDVIAHVGQRIMARPNVDLALGALTVAARLPADTPLFATARLAGFTAHYLEELAERPARYRAIARPST